MVLGFSSRARELRWLTVNAVPLEPDGEDDPGEAIVSLTDITHQRNAEALIRHQALHDPLTDLPNRRRVLAHLGGALAADGDGQGAAVLSLGVDQFHVVNDSLGHAAGDQLLVALAERLRALVRRDDFVGHLGGDEFVVVRPAPDEHGAVALAQRILTGLEEPLATQGEPHVVRASIGIALAAAGTSAEDALRDADTAMYRARDSGRGRYEVFDEDARAAVVRRHRAELGLRSALEAGDVAVHYQPVWRIADGQPVAVEALARWHDPVLGPVSPAEFIPVAEQTGLILRLGEWVLREACRQAAAWNRERVCGGRTVVTVNVAARQLEHAGFADIVADALAATGLHPRALGLEVTEGLLCGEAETAAELNRLAELGVRIVLDDFGTGYSSLSRLKNFPLEVLKIDRAFTAGLTRDPYDRAIVEAMVSIATGVGMRVVAEGVESEEQLACLRELGCELAQGFLFARPLPAAAARDLLLERYYLPASSVGQQRLD
jgi:diguanylate cyclase (GGDEF)-like protein